MHFDQWAAVFFAGTLTGSLVVYVDPFSTTLNQMGAMPMGPVPGEMGSSGILGSASSPSTPATPAGGGSAGAAPKVEDSGQEGGSAAPSGEATQSDGMARPSRGNARSGSANNSSPQADAAPRLTKHLATAPGLWRDLSETARSSGVPRQAALANDIAKQAEVVPSMVDRLPPLSEMTAYMVSSQALISRMKDAGIDCGVLEVQIQELVKPRGPAR